MSIDDLVRRTGDRLAAQAFSRRRLLGTTAVGLMSAQALAACGKASGHHGDTTQTTGKKAREAVASGAVPGGCGIARGRIHVCYEPWQVVRSEPADVLPRGRKGVAVRKGPEPDAPIVYKYGEPCIIKVGGIFGRQSERQNDRTGGVRNDCPAPPLRPTRGTDGKFVWGIPATHAISGTWNKGGWIAHSSGSVQYSRHDPGFDGVLCGPADLDFDCRAGTDASSKYKTQCRHAARPNDPGFKCLGGSTSLGHCGASTRLQVGIQENIDDFPLIGDLSHERYNLKYQADSTTIFWLVPGDLVDRHCYKCTLYNPSIKCPAETANKNDHGCCRAYSCVTVVNAKYVPAGVVGWINSSVLRNPRVAATEIPGALKQTGGTFNGY